MKGFFNGGRWRGEGWIYGPQDVPVSVCTSCWVAKLVIWYTLKQFCWHFGSQNDSSSAWKISVSKTRRFYFGGYLSAPINIHRFSWTCYKSQVPWKHQAVIQRKKNYHNYQISNDESNAACGSKIDQISRHDPCAWCSDMKYIDSCTTLWPRMSMNGHSFSQFIDHMLLFT